ncbi:MAG: glycosyltransferase [Candidatus Saccharimonadales bacterium]
MSVPVLIPARNEAAHIANTLDALPRDVEPIVIPNGCTDYTAEIAEDFGVSVLRGSEEGKLPALQFAIQHLGERALEPFVALDADSRPLRPEKWIDAMMKARGKLDTERPAMVTGSHIFEGINPLVLTFLNMSTWWNQQRGHQDPRFPMSAANLLFHLRDQETVDRILELPHIWPMEDKALRDVVIERNGGLISTVNRNARVVTDAADRYTGLFSNFKFDLKLIFSLAPVEQDAESAIAESYIVEAPPNSVTYSQFKSGGDELLLGLSPTA